MAEQQATILLDRPWLEHFPFDTVRPDQKQIIEFVLRSINEGKRYIVLDCGTGIGKSAVGVCLANYFARTQAHQGAGGGGYFLTTQKMLQEQYIRDFGGMKGDMCSVKGANNYTCKRKKDHDCGAVRRFIKTNKQDAELNKCNGDCNYVSAKKAFMASHLSTTNYSYFLNITKYTEDFDEPRQLLILDEAHNIEEEVSGFVDIKIDEKLCDRVSLVLPRFNNRQEAMRWIDDVFEPAVTSKVQELEEEMGFNPDASVIKEHDFMDKYMCKLHRFQEKYNQEVDNWIVNQIEPTAPGKQRELEFKPIDVSYYCQDVLYRYGRIVIFMSATIINEKCFAESVGIPRDLMAYMQVESPFPPEHKPIVYAPMGKMTMDSIAETLPKITKATEAILKRHPDQKGIIHTHSFKILNHLQKSVKSNRLLYQDDKNKDKILAKHHKTNEPTVLVSPSMQEGVDLKGDLSRFQIICKLPFPYMGDQLVKERMRKWDWWYAYETAKVLIQAMGRSIRDENDKAITYILDESWAYFYKKNAHLFPPSFHKQFK
jgi:Rad3-related DNA helicase